MDNIVEYPIDGVLDLHQFNPKDIKSLIYEYLLECKKRGIFRVRIIHGKGKGVLKQITHNTLEKIEFVDYYQLASEDNSSWGATIVFLRKNYNAEHE